jgi:hypothetical protein
MGMKTNTIQSATEAAHAMITQYEDRGDIPATEATRLRAALATDARTGLVEVRKVRLAVLRNRA